MDFLELSSLGPKKRPAKRVSLVTRSTIAKINGLFAMTVGTMLPMRGTIANSAMSI